MANDINSALSALAEGNLAQARKECHRILNRHKRDFDAQHLLGLIELKADKPKVAIKELHNALRIRSDVGSLHNNLGVAYQGIHDHVAALRYFQKAVSIAPANLDYLKNLAGALERAGLWLEAKRIFIQLIGSLEGAELAAARLSRILGEFDAAKGYLRQIYERLSPDTVNEMAQIIELEDGAEASIGYLKSVVAEFPEDIEYRRILALNLQHIGDRAGAISEYAQIIVKSPGHKTALWELAALGYFDEEATEQLIVQKPPADADSGELADWYHFRFRLCDAIKDFDKAGAFLVEANRQRSLLHPPDIDGARKRFQQIRWAFGTNRLSVADDSIVPIFVVGMPRSGTSLLEQILTSHSEIAGAGELTVLPTILNHYGLGKREVSFSNDDLDHVRAAYMTALGVYAKGARFVVDKMPNNFENLGVISQVFPDALVIHCHRDPVDTCFSCYKQFFEGDMRYMYDQKSLGQYYKLYAGLMDFFSERVAFMTIEYESLVADLAKQSRILLDAVGVRWEDQVLKFNENARFVRTASSQQVRNRIYNTSIDSWRPYKNHLRVLLKELDQA